MSPSLNHLRLLQEILSQNAAERPNKTALICEKNRLTYAEIEEKSNRLANAFAQNGIQPGDRILLYLMNGPELVIGIFAALKANAVFVVVDYANTFETLKNISLDCDAVALLTTEAQSEAAFHLLKESPLRLAIVSDSQSSQQDTGLLSYHALLANYPDRLPVSTCIDADLAYLIYTSGSTGKSKGVLVTHRCILSTVRSAAEYFELSEADVHTSPLPLSFSPGINQLFQTFYVGGTLVLEKSFAFPTLTLRHMESEQATSFAAVPTILSLLLKTDLNRYNLSQLRFISSIGSALAPSLAQQVRERLPNVAIYSTYGMAEASYSLGLEPVQIELRPTSVGKPFPGNQAWIVDETGKRLGPNEIGELVLRGGHVRSGYWNLPQETGRRFRPGPVQGETVCYTGDMFRMDSEGYFYFVARSDEIIKSGAKKVAPREIENVLYSLDGVLDAAAIGIPDPLMGQVIKAFVTPTPQARFTLTATEILKACQAHLEAYKVPSQVEIRESLPKTPSGKIIKAELN